MPRGFFFLGSNSYFFCEESKTRRDLLKMFVAGYSIELSKKGDKMSSNYPEGSMRGSGIYAEDWSGIFYCSDCEDEFELDGTTDDWGHQAFAECPDCGKGLEVDLPSAEELADDYYADYKEGK